MTQKVAGTSHYMAPELLSDEICTFPADVYSLGATLYHMSNGEPPFYFKDITPAQVFAKIANFNGTLNIPDFYSDHLRSII